MPAPTGTTGLPLPSDVVTQELDHIALRRELVYGKEPGQPGAGQARAEAGQKAPELPAGAQASPDIPALTELFGRTHREKPFGLALSGGGIRSATFNLGILQGLAEHNLIRHIDYLSTVSGGGYIGSWFHGLIHRKYKGDVIQATNFLTPSFDDKAPKRPANPVPAPPHEDPVSFLRKYSNYLAPRPGLFTADIWVILLIWIRNVALNQLILVPTVAAVVLALITGGFAQQVIGARLADTSPESSARSIEVVAFVLAGLALFWAVRIIYRNLDRVVRQTFHRDSLNEAGKPVEAQSLWVTPLVFGAAILIGCATRPIGSQTRLALIWCGLFVLAVLFQLGGGFIEGFKGRHADWKRGQTAVALLHAFWMVVVTATVITGLLWAWPHLLGLMPTIVGGKGPWLTITFAPPLVCLSLVAGVGLHIGLMGADYPDAAREWIARIGAMIALMSVAWIGFFVLAIFGPWAVAVALKEYTAVAATAMGGWIAAVVGGVMAGRSARTDGTATEPTATGRGLGLLMAVAPTLFMIGYLVLIATAVHAVLPTPPSPLLDPPKVTPQATYNVDVVGAPQGPSKIRVDLQPTAPPTWVARIVSGATRFATPYWNVLSTNNTAFNDGYWRRLSFGWGGLWPGVIVLIVVLGVVAVVASSRININDFSIHDFYKNRLVRCYLGASHGDDRKPNRLTGFDPWDDFPLADLVPVRREPTPRDPIGRDPYQGPYAIVNTTLNLNAGSELAKQERKGASFVFTPRFCGFAPSITKEDQLAVRRDGLTPSGYHETIGYSQPKGPFLGTALAISGAAAGSNMGYNTSGPMAFLLTVFNVRLGWWLGNPRRPKQSKYPGPVFAWPYLIAELLGQTTARSRFVNLSDGGHFDNLGLYELVRRRCRYVIVGDGEEDAGLTFGSLGGAIRKVRADFGVEIDIDPRPIQVQNGFSTAHCVMGTIHYPEFERSADGKTWERARGYLFYLKASIVGDEPADVTEYRSQHREFPHQSTGDQFFSESQFEAYRRLGLHVVRDALGGIDRATDERRAVADTFDLLDRKWYAPIPVTPERASRLADEYTALMTSLAKEPNLQVFADELLTGTAASTAPTRQTVAAALAVIQLMENVFTEFQLGHPASLCNPRNSGWVEVFARWANTPTLKSHVWPRFQDDYNKLFQDFMKCLQEGTPSSLWKDRPPRP
jgi:hypothetical protein